MNEQIVAVSELRQFLEGITAEGGRILAVLPNKIATRGNILRSLEAELVNVRVLWQ